MWLEIQTLVGLLIPLPPLSLLFQVFAEFNRIASKNLEGDFFEALDQYAPRFIGLFKTKKETVGQKLRELMQHMSWMVSRFILLLICMIVHQSSSKCQTNLFYFLSACALQITLLTGLFSLCVSLDTRRDSTSLCCPQRHSHFTR